MTWENDESSPFGTIYVSTEEAHKLTAKASISTDASDRPSKNTNETHGFYEPEGEIEVFLAHVFTRFFRQADAQTFKGSSGDFFAIVRDIYYTYNMEYLGEAIKLLKDWDEKSLSGLLRDLRTGSLKDRYSESAESRAEPPGGQLYAARADRNETAPAFIDRVYGGAGWLTGQFSRADLRKVDAPAEMGLRNWEKHHKQRAALNLPTVQERNDRELASPETQSRVRANPNAKLRSALWRREQK